MFLRVPGQRGAPLRKCNFHRKVWDPLRKSVKIGDELVLTGKHFHDLRHSCASLMLADNLNPKVIQELLGHSTISMTMDTYAHLMPNSHADVTSRFDRLLVSKLG
ncbi:MAG: tyrosine-type recombinase/integrase [Planctomycetaceae bacterium]